jgi:hypothetical protein
LNEIKKLFFHEEKIAFLSLNIYKELMYKLGNSEETPQQLVNLFWLGVLPRPK